MRNDNTCKYCDTRVREGQTYCSKTCERNAARHINIGSDVATLSEDKLFESQRNFLAAVRGESTATTVRVGTIICKHCNRKQNHDSAGVKCWKCQREL